MLRNLGGGQTATQVQQAIAGQVTSQRLYTQPAVQTGDTLTATTTTEQPFASGMTVPANSLVVGQSITVKGTGVYTTSTLTPPTQRARLRVNNILMVDTGPLTFPVSLTAYRYWFELQFIVRATGTTGAVEASGKLDFANLTGVTTVIAGPNGSGGDTGNPITINTTVDMPVALSVQFGAVLTGNSSSLRQLTMSSLKPTS